MALNNPIRIRGIVVELRQAYLPPLDDYSDEHLEQELLLSP